MEGRLLGQVQPDFLGVDAVEISLSDKLAATAGDWIADRLKNDWLGGNRGLNGFLIGKPGQFVNRCLKSQ